MKTFQYRVLEQRPETGSSSPPHEHHVLCTITHAWLLSGWWCRGHVPPVSKYESEGFEQGDALVASGESWVLCFDNLRGPQWPIVDWNNVGCLWKSWVKNKLNSMYTQSSGTTRSGKPHITMLPISQVTLKKMKDIRSLDMPGPQSLS